MHQRQPAQTTCSAQAISAVSSQAEGRGDWSNPTDVMCEQSILAKHLFFHSPVTGYNLKTEAGRQYFLEQQCHVLVIVTSTREEAREMERLKEQSGVYQFVGITQAHRLE